MRSILVSLPCIILVACATTRQAAAPADVDVIAFDPKIESENLTEMGLSFPWEIKNSTRSDATLLAIDWTLNVEGLAPETGGDATQREIGDGSSLSDVLKVTARFATTDEGFANRAQTRVLPYKATATFKINHGGQTDEYEAEWAGNLFAPKRPEVTVRPHAARYEQTIDLNITFVVSNPNAFAVPVETLDFAFFVLDAPVAKGSLAQGSFLAPSSEMSFDVERWIGREDMKDLAKRMERLKTVPYRAEISLKVGGIALPETLTGEVTFPR